MNGQRALAGPAAPRSPRGVVKCIFPGPAPSNPASVGLKEAQLGWRLTHFTHCTVSIPMGKQRPKELTGGAQGATAKCPGFLVPSPVLTRLLWSLEAASGQPLWRPALGGTSASSRPSHRAPRGAARCAAPRSRPEALPAFGRWQGQGAGRNGPSLEYLNICFLTEWHSLEYKPICIELVSACTPLPRCGRRSPGRGNVPAASPDVTALASPSPGSAACRARTGREVAAGWAGIPDAPRAAFAPHKSQAAATRNHLWSSGGKPLCFPSHMRTHPG